MYTISTTIIRRLTISAFATASLCMTFSAYALTPFAATYQFTYGNKTMGDATRKLTQNGNQWQYQFSSKIPLIGSATETSKFSFQQGQIQSVSYQRQTKILVHKDVVSMDFKPQQKQILTQRKGASRVLTWQNGVLDDLNAELQVREDLQNGGLKSSYTIASYKEVDTRHFIKAGTEKIKAVNGQTYDTVKVRLKHSRADKNTIFWLAPSLNYLPVKVTHQDDDESYGLLLKNVQ